MQNTIIYAITVGALLALLLSTLATPRKVNVPGNLWLSLFLFSFACVLLYRVFSDTHVFDQYPFLTGILEITRFAMSPALYFSVLYFTKPDKTWKPMDYLHFVPFALFFLYLLVVMFGIQDASFLSWFHDIPESVRNAIGFTVFVAIKLQMIVYWLLSYGRLIRHNRDIQIFASTDDPVSLWWLRYFLIGLAFVLLLSLNEVTELVPAIIPITHFGYLFLVFYLAYFSLRQQEIYPFREGDVAEIAEIIQETAHPRPTKRFSAPDLEVARIRLVTVMEVEKAFLDPNLGLPQLAKQVQLSTHDLSYLINEGFGENFFQFVNRYRIEEAKMLLISPQHKHLNILGIACEAGFRSKSTFNATFKKMTGMSPSHFVRAAELTKEEAA